MDLGIKGKNAIVTGSTKGIGRRVVDLLADEGVNVGICARNQDEVDAAVAEISAKGVKVVGGCVDVMDGDNYVAWLKSTAEELDLDRDRVFPRDDLCGRCFGNRG